MKRMKIINILILALMIVSIAGCSGTNNNVDSTEQAQNGENADPRGDFKRPDAMGEVTDITGNEITLKEIKMDLRTPDPNSSQAGQGEEMPDGSEGAQRRRPDDFDPDSMPTSVPIEYTGEILEIIIPTGVKITQRTRGEDGTPVEEEINLSELKKGDTLSITYASDGKTVESVSLSNGKMGFGGPGMNKSGGPDSSDSIGQEQPIT